MSVDKSKWRVAFTKRAEEDIREIFSFLVGREGTEIAENILNTFVQARDKLSIFPEQGRIPPELSRVNIFSYREIQAHPYRPIHTGSFIRSINPVVRYIFMSWPIRGAILLNF